MRILVLDGEHRSALAAIRAREERDQVFSGSQMKRLPRFLQIL